VKTVLVLVEGTWGGQWATDEGPDSFRAFLEAHDFTTIRFRGWSGDVDGVPSVLDNGHGDWIGGGYGLRYFLAGLPYEARNILCHSHGIAPVLYQATMTNGDRPLPIRSLVSVCSPPRREFQELGAQATRTGQIGYWRHVYAQGWDTWARLGQVFDGHWGWRRTFPAAHENVGEPGIGHSGIFTPAHRARFVEHGHFAVLQGSEAAWR
jgi:hypothetical protein